MSSSSLDSFRLPGPDPGVVGFGGGISCRIARPRLFLVGVRGSKAGAGASALPGALAVGGGVFGRGPTCADNA